MPPAPGHQGSCQGGRGRGLPDLPLLETAARAARPALKPPARHPPRLCLPLPPPRPCLTPLLFSRIPKRRAPCTWGAHSGRKTTVRDRNPGRTADALDEQRQSWGPEGAKGAQHLGGGASLWPPLLSLCLHLHPAEPTFMGYLPCTWVSFHAESVHGLVGTILQKWDQAPP